MAARSNGLVAVVVLGVWVATVVEVRLRLGGVPWWGYALAVVTAVPLAFWRRAPVVALVVIQVAAGLAIVALGFSEVAGFLVYPALFLVALQQGRRCSVLAGVITCIGYLAVMLLVAAPVWSAAIRVPAPGLVLSVEVVWAVVDLSAFVAAWALGDVMRSRRKLRAVAEEQRARRLVAEERLRIARELHDTLGHALVAITVRAGVAAHLGNQEESTEAFGDIKQMSLDALQDLRATLQLIRERGEAAPIAPVSDLTDLPGLVDRVRAAGVDVRLTMALDGAAVPAPVAQAGFRIVQEALTNVLRHAPAATAEVCVLADQRLLRLEVVDNGRGGPASVMGSAAGDDVDGVGVSGHGLRGMSERAALLGGQLQAGPQEDGGWRVAARLPLSPDISNFHGPDDPDRWQS